MGLLRQSQLVCDYLDTSATEVQAWPRPRWVRWSNEGPSREALGTLQQEADQPLLPCEGALNPGVLVDPDVSLIR